MVIKSDYTNQCGSLNDAHSDTVLQWTLLLAMVSNMGLVCYDQDAHARAEARGTLRL